MGSIEREFEECVAKGRISAFGDGPKLVKKELGIAKSDLNEAKTGLSNSRWKWSTIQAYYSMFHTARAFIYAKGFREKHHRCLRIAVTHLYSSEGESLLNFLDDFQLAKQMRENADYADDFSENGARKIVRSAEGFLDTARSILKANPA